MREAAPGGRPNLGSPEPLLAPNGPSFGGKIATAIPTSVPSVPIFDSHGNRPIQSIKTRCGDRLIDNTRRDTTLVGEEVVERFPLVSLE